MMQQLSIPILFKEFVVQMRGSRMALLLAIFVGVAVITTRLIYGTVIGQLDRGAPLLSAQIGQVLFIGLSLGLQLLTIFLAPAITLNAISTEHERGTALMLQLTPLAPIQVVTGKLVSGLALFGLLLLAALPIFSVVWLFGGINLGDVLRVVTLLSVTAVGGCVFGLFCSALTRQTYAATLICYALLVSLLGGTLFAANVWALLNGMRAAPVSYVVANPLAAMASALVRIQLPADSFTGGLRPLVLLSLLTQGVATPNAPNEGVPMYRAALVLYGGVSLILFWVTLHVAAWRQRWRLSKVDAALLMIVLGYVVLAYGARAWWLPGLGIAG